VTDDKLRRAAEAKVEQQFRGSRPDTPTPSQDEVRQTLHELRVHQIELEAQNAELRRTQAQLEVSRERYFELYDLAPVGYLTLEGGDRVLEANLTAASLLGTAKDALIGQSLMSFITADDQDIYYHFRRHLFDTGTPQGCELRLVRSDGALLWARLEATVARDDDHRPTCRAVIVNVSERKRAELEGEHLKAMLLRSQKMDAVGRLAGGVAHDFNNMLTVIIGHTDLLLESTEASGPAHAELAAIRTAAERAGRLTGQLLAFSSQRPITPVVFDVNTTVSRAITTLRRLLGDEMHLQWQPGDQVPPVRMDPTQFDQLLVNLVVNARDAASGAGDIVIATSSMTADAAFCATRSDCSPVPYAVLSVSDTGRGMDDATMGRIFEPFFTTKDIASGAGFGLATVYGMVRQNGGFIDVASAPRRGSRFAIYLPADLSAMPAAPSPDQPHPPLSGTETVLVVDDEPAVLQLTTRMLERMGYTVLAANGPAGAIHMAQEFAGVIHAVVSDVVMPEMNGRDLMNKIRALRPAIRYVLVSGYTANIVSNQGLLENGAHFLEKPFTKEALASALREALA